MIIIFQLTQPHLGAASNRGSALPSQWDILIPKCTPGNGGIGSFANTNQKTH